MTLKKRLLAIPVLQTAWQFLSVQNYIAILLLILTVVAIRLPIDYKRMMTITDNDYTTHIYYALDLLAGREVPAFTLAHSLWQLYLIFMWWLSRSRIDFWQSAIALQVASSVVSALIVYFWFGTLKTRPSAWIRMLWAATLVIVTPVIAPSLLDGAYYFGYIGLANYHNPTVHVLRPLALVMFFYALSALDMQKHSIGHTLFCAAVFSTGTFLKPSYTITLGPILVLFVLYQQFVRRRAVDWTLLVFGMGIPSILFLAPQFVITYIKGEPDGGIAFMPLVAARMMSQFLGIKLILSLVFPLSALFIFFRRIVQDRGMALAWLSFAWGAGQFYLLIELGSRYTHANFLWSAQISLFVLFATTIRFLLEQSPIQPRINWQVLVPYLAYLLHILSGIAYYIFCYVTPHYG